MLLFNMRQITISTPILFLCFFWTLQTIGAVSNDETRPYEFSFNIADFQHRYEKKDSDGIVTGEYGFITADGVYHETGYATNKNGDFVITKMKNRKITSLQVAEEIFKGKPEVAKRVIQVLAKSCGGCGIPVPKDNEDEADKKFQRKVTTSERNIYSPTLYTTMKTSVTEAKDNPAAHVIEIMNDNFETTPRRDAILREATKKKDINNEIFDNEIRNAKALQGKNTTDENIPDDLHYRFNYTITSHGHEETGYRDGKKDGSYLARGINGTDTKVEYISNEFGHQPNITFVNRKTTPDGKDALRGFAFEWIFQKR